MMGKTVNTCKVLEKRRIRLVQRRGKKGKEKEEVEVGMAKVCSEAAVGSDHILFRMLMWLRGDFFLESTPYLLSFSSSSTPYCDTRL